MDPDHELESNREYRRILAALSPDERLRLLGADFDLQRQLNKKREYRRTISELPPGKKLALLEELRNRAQILQGHRRSPPLNPQPTASAPIAKGPSHRFGGRATAGGVSYEARVAAFIAVKMLAGSESSVWDEINGADISAITLQAPEPVDDIVVNLRGDADARVFISAKERNGSIALTRRSPAFAETVDAFVRQFLNLPASARPKSRLVWAVPACVGRGTTHDLPGVLRDHRDAGDTPLPEFSRGRQAGQSKALNALLMVATRAWKKQSGNSPTDDELRQFLRQVFVEVYDFGPGYRLQREIEGEISSHIVADPKQARRAWERLEHFFLQADCHGVPVSPVTLRKVLAADGLTLKSPPDYDQDVARLRSLTSQNLTRLKAHTTLCFGPKPADTVHVARIQELSALLGAVKTGHLLVTGEPGCGKSGLIHPLVEALQAEGFPVVLLLAEDSLPGCAHALEQVLANWPDGARGFLITDALDAVRDVEPQRALRRLLRDVQEGQSGWTVIASVREFDLKHSRELREAFPGTGVAGYSSSEFAGVAHFRLSCLSEVQVDELAAKRREIRPFIENARRSAQSEGIYRSPFHLRLAAGLLHSGVTPARLADWYSPALLLRKFWERRIKEGPGAGEREDALKAFCRRMVDTHSMAVSLKQVPLSASGRSSVDELRSRGILQPPALRLEMQVGGDEIRFAHHVLHDYAIARSLIPETPVPFCDFAIHEPLLPIFYRQSFMFALEELWDVPDGRSGFWESAFKLESVPQLHGITRILAPLLTARRVEALPDLQPLLTAVGSSGSADSPGQRALLHLASGLQDTDAAAIRTGAVGWCAFVEQLAGLLPAKPFIEWPLVHILARMNALNTANDASQRLALNVAGRRLLAHHVSQKVSRERQYPARIAIETICGTFTTAPAESEHALLSLMVPDRLAQFPHHDLHDLADNLRHLGTAGDAIVLRLFEAAFAAEPESGQYEDTGSAIMSMRFETRDQWHMVHYALAGYYEVRNGENAALMTETVCITWNAVVRRRSDRRDREEYVLATVQFRGVACDLVEDYSHIWGRSFEQEENRILSHFEKLLREWAAAGDAARLNAALDRFAACNHTALMWTVFMEAGAAHPSALGVLMECVLNESLFLTHPDYSYGGTALLGALHKAGDIGQRERLERLILDLPKNVRLRHEEARWPTPSWVEHAQNRLLGALHESNIVLGTVRDLWRARQTAKALAANPKPARPRVTAHTFSDEEVVEQRGINLKDPANKEMFHLREALKPLLGRDNKKIDLTEVERHWPAIQQCERVLKRPPESHPEMAEELWGHLVGACENIARYGTWTKTSERWKTVRRILLKASSHPVPEAGDDEDAKEDRWPSWGWPSPRLDAARGLVFLAYHLGHADKFVAAALRRLCRDKSHPLRFNLALEVALLEQPSPVLMWELIDTFIANETKFSVLDALLLSVDRLWAGAQEKVKPRLRLITDRAMQSAPADNRIHETLAHTHLFHFLRTGDPECEAFIASLIADCDSERANPALGALLHCCRSGGWLTAGDGVTPDAYVEVVRTRTWSFFSRLLSAVQTKLRGHREMWRQLHDLGQRDAPAVKPVQEKLGRTTRLVDAIAMQLYFASGAFDKKSDKDKERLTPAQMCRFWKDAAPLFAALAGELHPHTAHHIVQTLYPLLPCAPREVFLLATQSIRSSAVAGFQHESLAVGDVVKLIQRALADHRDVFQSNVGQESECLAALLEVLDRFVEAGWAEARQLTQRLEEIYR